MEVRPGLGDQALAVQLQDHFARLPQLSVRGPRQAQPRFDPAVFDSVVTAGQTQQGQSLQSGQKSHVWFQPNIVVIPAQVTRDRGPSDGLEALLVLAKGKTHEAFATALSDNAALIKAAVIAACNVPDGRPANEASGVPAVGTPMSVSLWWQPDPLLAPQQWVTLPASSMVADEVAGPYPALPYIYVGSRLMSYDHQLPSGRVITRERFMLDVTKSVVVNFDEPDALLASPFTLSAFDHRFEVHATISPAVEHRIYVVIQPAELPLQLRRSSSGWYHDDKPLTESALRRLIQQRFGQDAEGQQPMNNNTSSAAPDMLRALGVAVSLPVSDAELLAWRQEVLAAIPDDVWVQPVFTLSR